MPTQTHSAPTDHDRPVRAKITLGHSDIEMRPIGLGCMGMSQSYGDADRAGSIATIRAAIDLGAGMLDTSDIYGAAQRGRGPEWFGHNEALIAEAIEGRRDEVVLATKFAARPSSRETSIDGRASYVAEACDASLKRLKTDYIDLYYYHRLDPNTPIEETVAAMGELVKAGKVRAIGLSEVSAELLRRAAAVHPISALQSEYSLWEREVEKSVIPACRALGITLVPYSPLGRALLAGTISSSTTYDEGDFRANLPRFAGENLDNNLRLVDALKAFSAARGATPGQIALAWLLAQPIDNVPIPGTRRVAYLGQNLAATSVPLSADDVAELSALFDPKAILGDRYAWGSAPSR
jgi:aryl-alcohol dehydrogenase-like predicted oxidoreductase